ncbi:response regulator [Synechococcus sp. H60.4]|uniref:response regulator n=1 Tax=unclassified Synechococcus TaxID=2626047 RepID=UPI0039C04801
MSHFVFASAELAPLLRQQARRFTTGYLHLHLKGGDPAEGTEPWVLTYYYGRLLFSADQPLNPQILLKRLSRFIPRLNLEWSQRAIRVLQERLIKDNSLPELLEAIAQLGLIKPGELEDALWLNLLTDFDRYLFERAGTCSFEVEGRVAQEAPIGGFELEPLLQEAARRHDRWAELKAVIPTLLAVPVVNWDRVNRYRLTDEQRQKLHALTKDGQSLEAIAKKLCRDRLEVASLFAAWAKKGLVSLQTPPELLQAKRHASTTLLAVDDSVVMQEILRQSLSKYHVITTGNPAEVLPLLFQHRPHLLLMDIAMPGIDGLELCRVVRSLEEFKSLPILMVTSRDSLLDRIRGKWSGATGYLTKPFSESQLNAEVERLLAQQQDHPSPRSPRGAKTNPPSPGLGYLFPFGDQAKA